MALRPDPSIGVRADLAPCGTPIGSGLSPGLITQQTLREEGRIQEGRFETISLRSTVIITNENLAVIVPNSKLVQNKFVNYSYGAPVVRLNVPIGVAYGSDLEKVSIALLEAARSVERVLNNPEPKVHFTGFGDSSIDLQIRVWIDKPRDHTVITSDVNFAVEAAFRKYNIEIPFPQRDLHVRTGSLGLAQDDSGFTKIEANPRQP